MTPDLTPTPETPGGRAQLEAVNAEQQVLVAEAEVKDMQYSVMGAEYELQRAIDRAQDAVAKIATEMATANRYRQQLRLAEDKLMRAKERRAKT